MVSGRKFSKFRPE